MPVVIALRSTTAVINGICTYERNDHNELWSMVIDFIGYAEMATATTAEGGM
jgi:hypothetical protein